MTLTITLPAEVEERVEARAAAQNISVEEFVGNAVKLAVEDEPAVAGLSVQGPDDGMEGESSNVQPRTGRELLEKWQRDGVLWRTDMTEDTVEYADKLRERTQRRRLGQS